MEGLVQEKENKIGSFLDQVGNNGGMLLTTLFSVTERSIRFWKEWEPWLRVDAFPLIL